MFAAHITVPSLPGAMFTSRQALLENVDDRIAYEAAVAEFAVGRDTELLSERLEALAYDSEEIAWHIARPGKRMAQMFA